MFRTCLCGDKTIVGRYIDDHLIILDAEPVTDGQIVLRGDLGDEPTALWAIDDEEKAAFWNVPFDSDRYDRHECKETR